MGFGGIHVEWEEYSTSAERDVQYLSRWKHWFESSSNPVRAVKFVCEKVAL